MGLPVILWSNFEIDGWPSWEPKPEPLPGKHDWRGIGVNVTDVCRAQVPTFAWQVWALDYDCGIHSSLVPNQVSYSLTYNKSIRYKWGGMVALTLEKGHSETHSKSEKPGTPKFPGTSRASLRSIKHYQVSSISISFFGGMTCFQPMSGVSGLLEHPTPRCRGTSPKRQHFRRSGVVLKFGLIFHSIYFHICHCFSRLSSFSTMLAIKIATM